MTLISIGHLQKAGINSNTAKKLVQDTLGTKKQAHIEDIGNKRDKKKSIRGLMAPKGYTDDEEVFSFQFNPEQISDSKGNDWYSSKFMGFGATQLFWVGGQERNINFDLFLDATAESLNAHQGSEFKGYDAIRNFESVYPNGVMDMVEKLQAFQYPISDEKPRFIGNVATPSPRFEAPPIVIFVFGLFYMECGLTGLDISYDLFDEKLIPRRATCNVTLTVYDFDRITRNDKLINWNDKS